MGRIAGYQETDVLRKHARRRDDGCGVLLAMQDPNESPHLPRKEFNRATASTRSATDVVGFAADWSSVAEIQKWAMVRTVEPGAN